MNNEIIIDTVIETIISIQAQSGIQDIIKINNDTVPINTLGGFDSMRIMEVVTILSVKLKIDIPGSGMELFTNGKRNFTISEIANQLSKCKLINTK